MPSDKIMNEKKAVVAALADEFKSAKTLVLAKYLGLTVAEDTELRNTLRAAGVEYKVVKNTMGILAAKEAGLDELAEHFKESTAVAYSVDDLIAPAKLLKQFAKTHEVYELKAGASDGAVLPYEDLMALADIPDLPVLYGKLVGSLISPIAGLAMLTKAIADKCEEQGAATAAEIASGKSAAVETEAEAAAQVSEEVPAQAAE